MILCTDPQPEGGQSGNCPPKFSQTYVRYLLGAATSYIILPPPENINWLLPCCGSSSQRAIYVAFASRSEKNYDVTEAQIANKFVVLDFYVAAFCNFGFTICGSHIEQVWPPLL